MFRRRVLAVFLSLLMIGGQPFFTSSAEAKFILGSGADALEIDFTDGAGSDDSLISFGSSSTEFFRFFQRNGKAGLTSLSGDVDSGLGLRAICNYDGSDCVKYEDIDNLVDGTLPISAGTGITITNFGGNNTIDYDGTYDEISDAGANASIGFSTYSNAWTTSKTDGDFFSITSSGAIAGAHDVALIKSTGTSTGDFNLLTLENTGNASDGTILRLTNTDSDVDSIIAPNFSLNNDGDIAAVDGIFSGSGSYGSDFDVTGLATFSGGVVVDGGTLDIDVTSDFSDNVVLSGSATLSVASTSTFTGAATFTAAAVLNGGFTLDGHTITTLNDAADAGSLTDGDTTIATTAAIIDYVTGYVTGSGTTTLDQAYNAGETMGLDATNGDLAITVDADQNAHVTISTSASTTTLPAGGLLALDNADTDTTLADGIMINATGSITDAIDVSATNIVNGLNLGANVLLGTGGATINFDNFDVDSSGNVTAVGGTFSGDVTSTTGLISGDEDLGGFLSLSSTSGDTSLNIGTDANNKALVWFDVNDKYLNFSLKNGGTDNWHNMVIKDGAVGIGDHDFTTLTSSQNKFFISGLPATNGTDNVGMTIVSRRNTGSWTDGGTVHAIDFYSADTSGAGAGVKASIRTRHEGTTGGGMGLSFWLDAGSGLTEATRWDKDLRLQVGPGSFTGTGKVSIKASTASQQVLYGQMAASHTAELIRITDSSVNDVFEVDENYDIYAKSGVLKFDSSKTTGSGSASLTASNSSVAVSFDNNMDNTNYAISLTPDYDTTVWYSSKATTGFTINVGTTSGSTQNIDWSIRPY